MFQKISSLWAKIFSCSGNFDIKPSQIKGYTPVYLKIAEDLKSKNMQVFEAAVYYLCIMAAQKQTLKNEIIPLLKNCTNLPDRQNYINRQLANNGLSTE